jgi:hypothetical protein
MGTGVTPTTTAYAYLAQNIEGFNCADLGFGTASAATVTLSFWVRSSVTGAFGVGLRSASGGRSYIASYTISSANTFEYKTITILGDTSGAWLTDNGIGIRVDFDLGVGPTYSTTAGSWQSGNFFGLTGGTKLAATTGATFYITGVQLEKGSTATPFEFRDYGRELILCQRYCFRFNATATDQPWTNACAFNTTIAYGVLPLPVTMRVIPTVTFSSSSVLRLLGNSTGILPSASAQGNSTPNAVELFGTYTGLTSGFAYWFRSSNAGDWILGTAEL